MTKKNKVKLWIKRFISTALFITLLVGVAMSIPNYINYYINYYINGYTDALIGQSAANILHLFLLYLLGRWSFNSWKKK